MWLKKKLHPVRDRLVKRWAPNAITLDYPPRLEPRWGEGKSPHANLQQMFSSHRDAYAGLLGTFAQMNQGMARIGEDPSASGLSPKWGTGWFDALDAVAQYCLIGMRRPKQYLEIGSGISTRFARCAIRDFGLPTRIISVDPHPRAEVDEICDETIRGRLEDVDITLFDRLQPGDFLFVDGSHRTFMNSDCTVFFLDVLPRLPAGVICHIHDIFLPYDYPQSYLNLYYSEQYLLASSLLSGRRLDPILPNAFVSSDPQLLPLVRQLWLKPEMAAVGGKLGKTSYLGTSFWCEVT